VGYCEVSDEREGKGMNREIKFRGKPLEDVYFDNIGVHISKDDFVYGNLIVDGEQAWIVKGVIESTNDYITLEQWIPIDPNTIGQFTGQYDRVEKPILEIYSGDIVKNIFTNEIFVILWTIEGYYSCIPINIYNSEKNISNYIAEMKPHFTNVYDYYNTMEIIGNIHDKEDV
jgi:hypothetical protein